MKIKMFSDSKMLEVEKSVNEFIQDKKVIDIKFTSGVLAGEDGIQGCDFDTILVMYEEVKN